MSNQLNQNNQKKHTRPSSTPDEYSNLSIGSKGCYPVPDLPDITQHIHYKQLAFNFYEKTFLNNFENGFLQMGLQKHQERNRDFTKKILSAKGPRRNKES